MNLNSNKETKAFISLLVPNQRRIQAFILTLVPNINDAEDIYQETISEMCHRSAWLDHGKVMMVGETHQVVAAYQESQIPEN